MRALLEAPLASSESASARLPPATCRVAADDPGVSDGHLYGCHALSDHTRRLVRACQFAAISRVMRRGAPHNRPPALPQGPNVTTRARRETTNHAQTRRLPPPLGRGSPSALIEGYLNPATALEPWRDVPLLRHRRVGRRPPALQVHCARLPRRPHGAGQRQYQQDANAGGYPRRRAAAVGHGALAPRAAPAPASRPRPRRAAAAPAPAPSALPPSGRPAGRRRQPPRRAAPSSHRTRGRPRAPPPPPVNGPPAIELRMVESLASACPRLCLLAAASRLSGRGPTPRRHGASSHAHNREMAPASRAIADPCRAARLAALRARPDASLARSVHTSEHMFHVKHRRGSETRTSPVRTGGWELHRGCPPRPDGD